MGSWPDASKLSEGCDILAYLGFGLKGGSGI